MNADDDSTRSRHGVGGGGQPMLSASSGRVESLPGTFGIPSTSPLLSSKGEVTPFLTAAILNDVLEEIVLNSDCQSSNE